MNIVSNSTPLIALSRMKVLPLLGAIFQNVFIPTEVFREVARYILLDAYINAGYPISLKDYEDILKRAGEQPSVK